MKYVGSKCDLFKADQRYVKKINKKFRNKDKSTDCLSFEKTIGN